MEFLPDVGAWAGLVSFLALMAVIGWQIWKTLSPKIQEDVSRIELSKDKVYADLMARFDRIKQSESGYLDRIEALEKIVDAQRALRHAAENKLIEAEARYSVMETKYDRVVEDMARLGRAELVNLADEIDPDINISVPTIS